MVAMSYHLEDADVPYEDDVAANPYSTKSWWRYLQYKSDAPHSHRNILAERALTHLPGSYKIWHYYLQFRVGSLSEQCVVSEEYEEVNQLFERAFEYMNKMPRIWIEYLQFLIKQKYITRTRHTFDRALQSLPVTQHERLWKVFLPFVKTLSVEETAVRVFRRYIKLFPDSIEEYISYLQDIGRYNEMASLLAKCVNDPKFVSREGKSKHQLWLELCDVISKHPDQVTCLKPEPVIRAGLAKFTDETGRLWIALADYYIRIALFEKARDVFEEALDSVLTVRDFAQVWDGYTLFVDNLIAAKVEEAEKSGSADNEHLEFLMARYEHLIERRPLLLSNVLLKQNPHNIAEWHKRAKLFPNDPQKVVATYTEAVKTVDPEQATGKVSSLWTAFARFYEQHKDLKNARSIFEKGVTANFKHVEDLASLWCEYAEMELRNNKPQQALSLLQRATRPPKKRGPISYGGPVQDRLHRSTKLWNFYVDLEESLGTLATVRAAYDQLIKLKVATPQTILNYTSLLEENNYFEDSFQVYEKGVSLFGYPYNKVIWVAYLTKFVKRYRGTKLERLRDLFEQALEAIPKEDAMMFYVLYATVEEEHGLARHAMNIYERGTREVGDKDKMKMYLLYISRATEFFGVTKTREIYEAAIQNLPDDDVKPMCLRFAKLEEKLGEIERARAIYIHCSQYCDPSKEVAFWKIWRDFEIQYGNQDTFREMLRIKRSVAAKLNTQVNVAVAMKQEDDMTRLEQQAELPTAESIKSTVGVAPGAAPVQFTKIKPEEEEQPEDVALDENGEPEVDVEQLEVPQAVFGSAQSGKMGALERLKRKRGQ